MNSYLQKFNNLFAKYNINQKIIQIEPLTGGFLHKMFYVKTKNNQNQFQELTIKALNPQIMIKDEAKSNMIYSEKTASKIKNEFAKSNLFPPPTICCAKSYNKINLLENGGEYFFIYPFIKNQAISQITPLHCEKIGEILGYMHSLKIRTDAPETPNNEKYILFDFQALTKRLSKTKNYSKYLWYEELYKNAPCLDKINNEICSSNYKPHLCLCHRDLDSKNVLWNNNFPIIIDWECVGYSDLLIDFIQTAFYWSKPQSEFSTDNFNSFIKGYFSKLNNINPEIINICNINICLTLCCYSPLEWLNYNIKNLINEDFEKNSCETTINEITNTLSQILWINNNKNSNKSILNLITDFIK